MKKSFAGLRLPFFIATAAAALLAGSPAPAAPTPPPGPDEKSGHEKGDAGEKGPAESADPKLSVTHHSVTIGGKKIDYTATVGYLLLRQEPDGQHPQKGEDPGKGGGDGGAKDDLKTRAKIFFVAYTRDGGDPATRPVAFAFNGGPGAAAVWLHLGALGPRRVKLTEIGDGAPAPYELADNESSWLDDTDLVFIDPVSTGYSRAASGENAQAFHAYEEDIKSVAEFVRLYTTRNKRWLSPKLVIGESYGAARAAGLCSYLQDRLGIFVNGVVLVSGLLNAQDIDFAPGNDLPYTLFLPGYATAAWYHKKLSPELQSKTVEEVRKAAEEFAGKDYLIALHQGDALPDSTRKEIAARLSAFTGLPVDLILRYRLRISNSLFREELLKAQNRVVGRFDSRATGVEYDPDGSAFDPSFETMRGVFTADINDYLRNDLKFETDLPYEALAPISWDMSAQNHYLEVQSSLSRAMSANPAMKVWVVAGYYDLAISYEATHYAVRQMLLDPALRPNLSLTTYDGGHMIYTTEEPLKKFKADFETFLGEAVKVQEIGGVKFRQD